MKFWIEFFKDKRFGWRFKLANFIMRDWLRIRLALDILMTLENIKEHYECLTLCKKEIDKAISATREIMGM